MRALGGWGKHKELPRTSPKPQSEHEADTEQVSLTNVSGQCEVVAKCERTTELPPNSERKRLGPTRTERAPRGAQRDSPRVPRVQVGFASPRTRRVRQVFRSKWVCAKVSISPSEIGWNPIMRCNCRLTRLMIAPFL